MGSRYGLPPARLFVLLAVTMLCGGRSVLAQTGANVLVVVNKTSAASEAIGRRYADVRQLPPENVCSIQTSAQETIERDVYEFQIEEPIWNCIAASRGHDRILYIVLTKDVPIRVRGTAGRNGTNASVDSELTLLYRRRSTGQVPLLGFVANPYFAGTAAPAAIKPFTHDVHDIYLVTRLDGYTKDDVLKMIDRAAGPSRHGRFVLDAHAPMAETAGDKWLRASAARLGEAGLRDRVRLDQSATVVTGESDVLGYYSWGSNDQGGRASRLELKFAPGALAGMFVGTDARTFREPPPTWVPDASDRRESMYAGSNQSLTADLIREGVTGASGYVNEPYLDGIVRPDILFPTYVSGRNLAESYYAAIPYLSWQVIVVGDPLCAPFADAPQTTAAMDPEIDPVTEVSSYFGRRRMASLPSTLDRTAAISYVRAEARGGRGDTAGVYEALQTVVELAPDFYLARVALAAAESEAGHHDRAVKHYRVLLASNPNDVVALNNLAYELAEYLDNPQDALPLAERACSITKNPMMLDTLAWIQHLLGRDVDAARTIRRARSIDAEIGASHWEASTIFPGVRDPSREHQNPEVLWHAAVIYAAVDEWPRAAAELNLALKLKPQMADREEVKKLRQRLDAVTK